METFSLNLKTNSFKGRWFAVHCRPSVSLLCAALLNQTSDLISQKKKTGKAVGFNDCAFICFC